MSKQLVCFFLLNDKSINKKMIQQLFYTVNNKSRALYNY